MSYLSLKSYTQESLETLEILFATFYLLAGTFQTLDHSVEIIEDSLRVLRAGAFLLLDPAEWVIHVRQAANEGATERGDREVRSSYASVLAERE